VDLRDYIDVLRRRWRFVASCVVLGLLAALAATALMPRTYTAQAQLFIATNDKTNTNAYAGGLFTQQRVKSYTKIANSPAVLDGVINKLDLSTTPDRLAGKISTQAPLDTAVVNIQVRDASATRAQAIADETAVQFARYIDRIEKASTDAPPLVKASVVGNPGPPAKPTSPRPQLNVAIGLVAGFLVGVSGAVLRHSLDTTVRSSGDVRRRTGLHTVGALPRPGRRRANNHRGDTRPRDEALSQLRTRLRPAGHGGLPNSLLVTSAVHTEGRTDTAVDLAVNVARTGRRVVLVEGDLRRPRLAGALGLRDGPGLTDVATGDVALADALQTWEAGALRVLTSGTASPAPDTLLSSPKVAQVLHALEADADLVVVDSPPLLPYADATALASETEAVLLVVRIGRARYDLVQRALESLASVDAHVLGAVVTGVPPERLAGGRRRGEAARPSDAPVMERRPPAVPDTLHTRPDTAGSHARRAPDAAAEDSRHRLEVKDDEHV
jgi:non-specific protein-tyrosine kinase